MQRSFVPAKLMKYEEIASQMDEARRLLLSALLPSHPTHERAPRK